MSTTSDQYALPYPDGTDQVAVAADVKGLAVKSGVELGGVEDRANAYADAGDTATLTSAESYADTGDSTTLTTAKTYTDDETQKVNPERGLVINPANIDTWADPSFNGWWDVESMAYVDRITNAGGTLPIQWPGRLYHESLANGISMQQYHSYDTNSSIWFRAWTGYTSKVFGPWRKLEKEGPQSVRHTMLVNEMRLMHGGVVGTAGAAPVTLIFDHGTNNFASEVLPTLRAHGFPSTLALNSDMYNPDAFRYQYDNLTTWEQIDGWTVNDKVEVANHGRTHLDATGYHNIQKEIVGGLEDLQANLPSKPILSWVQSSATYDPFGTGTTTAEYTDTEAGRMIIDHHAVAAGTMTAYGPLYERRGEPLQGVYGEWIDNGTATAKTRITEAYEQGKGVIIRCHPELLNTTGITTADLTAFLDWLAVEQSAGRVQVLPFTAWSIADAGRGSSVLDVSTSLDGVTLATNGTAEIRTDGASVELSIYAATADTAGDVRIFDVGAIPAKLTPAGRKSYPVWVTGGPVELVLFETGRVWVYGVDAGDTISFTIRWIL